MPSPPPPRWSPLLLGGVWLLIVASPLPAADVQFGRDVLPLLSDRCFHCHGPDEANREADLRLDQRDSAVSSGAIVPGKPAASELMARVTSDNESVRMPPADAHRKPLSPREVEVLRRWIQQGAEWGRHWSFEPPRREPLPDGVHPVDHFVRERLQDEQLAPSPRAPLHTLARRVSFDLTGLPPTVEDLRQLGIVGASQDKDTNQREAYGRHIDRLLQSPHYGERMAMWWLDAARYSDTDGYQQDATRTNWPWRDWVIDAFNANMPFDQFTIEQFAGDLLPDATPEQRLATCFHRNHMANGEGGRDPEESRVDYVLDRINTTGAVWLGLTLGCCQCHSHKFDPVSQADYYRLYAFFNSIDEDGKAGGGAKPFMKYRSPYAKRAVAEAEQVVQRRADAERLARADAEAEFNDWLVARIKALQPSPGQYDPWQVLGKAELRALESVEGTKLEPAGDGVIQATGPSPVQDDYRVIARPPLQRLTGLRLEVLPHASHTDGKLSRGATGEFVLTDVKLQVRRRGRSQVRDIELDSAVADAEKKVSGRNYGKVKDTLDDDPRNGWTTETHDARQPHQAVFALAEPLQLAEDEELIFVMLHRSTRGDANIGRFRLAATDQPGQAVRSLQPMPLQSLATAVAEAINSTEEELDAAAFAKQFAKQFADPLDYPLRQRLLGQFLSDHAAYQQVREQLTRAERQLSEVKRAAGELKVMVLAEREQPRDTHVLERGVWDQHGRQVAPGVPAAVLERPAESTQTRLDLARWLVSTDNPLTARVVVNHLWQLCFGAGLVRTPEDFGLQGEPPTHPRLLDWLAVELMESDWDVQHLLRLIVTSETYAQSSHLTPALQQRDPENRLLARGARFRLPSWMIRDAALRSSGLLNTAVGGPPTMPYQPEGVWEENFMGRFQYRPSQGPAQHRRTVYAFWRRAAAPTFLFDNAQRRVCEVRQRRTNTPLHALTLLNDVSMLEASRALAKRAAEEQPDVSRRPQWMFRRVLARAPTNEEASVLDAQRRRLAAHYREHPEAARRFLRFGQPEHQPAPDADDQVVPLAVGTVVASMLYNLDEAMTHE